MNIENMTRLANFLENIESERFNIAEWVSFIERYDGGEIEYMSSDVISMNVCDTAGCIAGWAVCLMNGGEVYILDDNYYESDYLSSMENKNAIRLAEVSRKAADWLGLTSWEAQRLFVPDGWSVWDKYASDYGLEKDNGMNFYSNIHPKYAADMLRRLANNEIKIPYEDKDW